MQYIVKGADGKEYGPVDKDVLGQWVESGRILSDTMVRNTLVTSFQPAKKISELEQYFVQENKVVDKNTGKVLAIHSLTEAIFRSKPAGVTRRFLSWVSDLVILFLVAFATLQVFSLGADADSLAGRYQAWFTFMLIFSFSYYFIGLAFKAQTLGQWWWGVMIIQPSGSPVMAVQAFFYTLISVPFWPLTILTAILPEGRVIQDHICGVSVVRITAREA